MRRVAACLVLAAMISGCVGTTPPTPIVVSATPPASAEPTPDSTKEATPTLTPTATPTATATPRPTPTPVPTPQVTTAIEWSWSLQKPGEDLAGACDGIGVGWAAEYGGKLHPLVVIPAGTDQGSNYQGGEWPRWDSDSLDPSPIDLFPINEKWFHDKWPGEIQLVVCVEEEKTGETDLCGTFSTDEGGGDLFIEGYKTTLRVVRATTGKTLQSKTYSAPPRWVKCAKWFAMGLSGDGPWYWYGGPGATYEEVNAYATKVSKQPIK